MKSLSSINNEFDSANKTVKKHLLDMLREVRKKRGDKLIQDQDELEQAFEIMCKVPPFSYLPHGVMRKLIKEEMHKVTYSEGEVIVQQGKRDDDVYILASGRIVMVRLRASDKDDAGKGNLLSQSHFKFLGYLDAPAYFGDLETLFESTRQSQVLAGSQVTVYRISGDAFQALLEPHPAFRLKLALGLRQSCFTGIEGFVALVSRFVMAGENLLDFPAILESYREMIPAIHANINSPELDVEGWTYAIRRLPDTVTHTYVYLLSSHVPMPFVHKSYNLVGAHVKTVARRRQAYELDHGKLLVVLRDRFSDTLDFLSLLCCHMHESAKLRAKLVTPSALHTIHQCLWNETTGAGHHPHARNETVSIDDQKTALDKLPLTEAEKKGIRKLWPQNFLYRVWDMIVLHENIQVRSDLDSASAESTDRWAEGIRKAALDLLQTGGEPPTCIQTDVEAHIISSNTTSVRNLLSPFILKNKEIIHEWGSEKHPEIINHPDLSDSDKLSALCNAYMKHHRSACQEQEEFDSSCFKTLRQTEMTGIQVELIDLNKLQQTYIDHNIDPDPYLASCFSNYSAEKGWATEEESMSEKRLLVNIDYAFGMQAEQLISALCLVFGESLASVGIMGKAGGLQGSRGDIIVADYLIHFEGDEQTLIDNTGVNREDLHTLSMRTVHEGGVLTVLGTLLQDKRLLNYYKKLYGCVSLEMEGSFYARELGRFKKAGLLSSGVEMRFLYYVSDTPLSIEQTQTLSQDMSIAEVIPPQYAVTKALLRPVLMSKATKAASE